MAKKFGVPFAGAAQVDIDDTDAAKGSPFPSDQVDESRKGAMKGSAKYANSIDCEKMQSTGQSESGFTGWKKMESF